MALVYRGRIMMMKKPHCSRVLVDGSKCGQWWWRGHRGGECFLAYSIYASC